MGGLYSRAAIRVLATTDSTVKVRSLTTVGTPWQGSFLSDYANDSIQFSECRGDKLCDSAMKTVQRAGAATVRRAPAGRSTRAT